MTNMSGGMKRIAATAALLAASAPASGQHQPATPPPNLAAPVLQQLERDCTEAAADEILVCGRREQRSPYRIPEPRQGFDITGPIDSVSRERHRLMEGGEAGIQSCSTVGPGGWTGCQFNAWKRERQQRAGR